MKAGTDQSLESGEPSTHTFVRDGAPFRGGVLALLAELAAVAALYYAAARLGLVLQLPGTNASAVWPPSGIGLAAVLLFGLRVWPGIAIGAFLANLLTLPNTPAGVLAAGAICLGNTLEHVIAWLLLRRLVPASSPFDRARSVFCFVATACLACAVASTNGVTSLWLTGILPAQMCGTAWFTWWLGDTAGMLVLTPAIYCWWRAPRLGLSTAQGLELVVLVTLALVTAELLFGGWIASEVIASLPYLVVPTLLWAAFRFGQRETSSLAVLLSVIAVGYVAWWMRHPAAPEAPQTIIAPFLSPAISANDSLLMLQIFVCAVAVTAITLAAAVSERSEAVQALRESEERLRLAQQAAHIGAFEWNIRTGVNIWTPELEAMYGLEPGEFGRSQTAWEQLVHPEDRTEALRCVEQAFETGLPTEGEWRVIWRDRSVHWIAGRFQVFKDETGKPLRLTGINIDITQRKLAEERFRLVVEAAPNGMVMIDQYGKIVLANAQMEKLFGYSKEELLGQAIEMLVPDNYRDQHPQHRAAFLTAPRARMMGAGRDLFGRGKDGREVPVEIGLNPIQTVDGPLVLASIIDITQRKRAEQQLKSTLDQLHGLTAHLEFVREEERTRIARELHDELGQALTGLKLELAWMRNRLGKENHKDGLSSLLSKTAEMSALIDTTIQTMRRIVTELRPGVLDEFGLAAALEWQGQEFYRRTGIDCTVAVSETCSDPDCSSALFRIVQEALTNVTRHARATHVEIHLSEQLDSLLLIVQDNGRGMSHPAMSSRLSFGLLGMQERAVAAGGTFHIESSLGGGTKIMVRVPLSDTSSPTEPQSQAEAIV